MGDLVKDLYPKPTGAPQTKAEKELEMLKLAAAGAVGAAVMSTVVNATKQVWREKAREDVGLQAKLANHLPKSKLSEA